MADGAGHLRKAASRVWFVLKSTVSELGRIDALSRAAALAFYAETALIPVLGIATAVAGAVFGQDAARGAIVRELGNVIGPDAARMIQTALLSAAESEAQGIAALVATAALVFTSSGVFIQVRNGLYAIWDIEPAPEPLWRLLRSRATSFGVVLALGLLMLISLLVDAALAAFGERIDQLVPGAVLLIRGLNLIAPLLFMTLLLAAMYKILTLNRVSLGHAIKAALITAFLFQAGKLLITTYISVADVGSSYGAAGALIVLLVWIYFSGLIVFTGAALTKSLFARPAGGP